MTSFGGARLVSRPAVAVASASSCALVCAAAIGAVTPPVVAGALGAAAVTAVLSARAARSGQGEHDLLTPLPMGQAPTGVTVIAPRARELAAGRPARSDAA